MRKYILSKKGCLFVTSASKRIIKILVIIMCFGINTNYASCLSDSTKPWIPDIPVWKLVPTRNNWMFLNLNTMTGEIQEVQFSMEDETRFGRLHSVGELLRANLTGNEPVDRFDLVPTKNIYTFLLLDKISGSVWQIQWGENKFRRKIDNYWNDLANEIFNELQK